VAVRYALRAPLRPLVVTNIYNDPVYEIILHFQYSLLYPKLTNDAVPTIFPGCPSYLSREVKKRRIICKTDLNLSRKKKVRTDNLEGS
jgi:hypothetical protein